MRVSIIMLSLAALVVAGSPTLAKQKQARAKVTYEEAWMLCKKFVEDGVTWHQTQQRATRGAICMQRYGYRI